MQIVGFVDLYKTPLDSNYTNVYDGYSDFDQYHDFLNANFERRHITTGFRSRADSAGVFDLEVAGYNSLDLHDYNYIVFGVDYHNVEPIYADKKAAFILSTASLNDGTPSNSSVRLHCKLDAWANHYVELKNNFNEFEHSRATLDMGGKYIHYPVQHAVSYNSTIESVSRLSKQGSIASVLWLHITLSPSVTVKYYGYDSDDKTLATYKIPFSQGLPFDMYIPCAIYESFSPQRNFRIKAKHGGLYSHKVGGETVFDESIYYEQIDVKDTIAIPRLNSSMIYDCELTFFAPFHYTLNKTTESGKTVYNIKTLSSDARLSIVTDSADLALFGYCFVATSSYDVYSDHENVGFSYSFQVFTPLYDINNRYKTDSTIANSEQQLFEYPFTYQSVYYNGKEKNIIQEQDYRQNIDVYISLRNQPQICFGKTHDNNYYQKSYDELRSNGKIPTAVSEYDEYMNQQSNRRFLSIASGVAMAGVNAVSGNTVGFTNNFLSLANIIAKEQDLKIAPFNYKEVDIASDDLFFQNDILLLNHKPVISTEEFTSIVYDEHFNGLYVNNTIKSIFSFERDIFDIDKTVNCKINGKLSNDDKIELSTAFNNGVTRWHLDTANSASIPFLTTFNKQVFNMYRSLL